MQRDIPVFIVKKQSEKPKVLITVHVRHSAQPVWNVVKSFLARAGAQDLPGAASRGPIFRSIAEDLDRLTLQLLLSSHRMLFCVCGRPSNRQHLIIIWSCHSLVLIGSLLGSPVCLGLQQVFARQRAANRVPSMASALR